MTTVTPLNIVDASEACNIGPAELRVRRVAFAAAAIVLAVAALAVIAGVLPTGIAPWLAPIAGGAVVSGLQVRNRFCVNYGLRGVVGMSEKAGAVVEADRTLRLAHLRRSWSMVGWGVLATVAWFVGVSLLMGR